MPFVRVERWGDGLAVRLPEDLVAGHSLAEGDEIEICVVAPAPPAAARAPRDPALLDGLWKYRGRLPADFRFDRAEANERR